MRKVIVGAMVSMDGVMQAPGGPEEDPTGGFKFGGWVAPLWDDPVFGEELGKLFGEPFDLLLGRRTYDIFAAHWPYAEGGPYDDIAKTFNRCQRRNKKASAGRSNNASVGAARRAAGRMASALVIRLGMYRPAECRRGCFAIDACSV